MSTMRKMKSFFIPIIAVLALLGMSSIVSADTRTGTKTLKAGEIVYFVDSNISGNQVSANRFTITPESSSTRYDAVYASGTRSSAYGKSVVNCGKKLAPAATSAYVKSSASQNSGYLVGVRVRSGSVKVSITSTSKRAGFFISLSRRSSANPPLNNTLVPKGKRARFIMKGGNSIYIPLIFGGTKGTRIDRKISASYVEEYIFNQSYVTRTLYQNGKKKSVNRLPYNTEFTYNNYAYRTVLMLFKYNASSRSTGILTTVKGSACYSYPTEFLNIVRQVG
ncbi:MAG: hypothetical protein IKE58_08550 [Blautia sp.]|nr:hypothetical protein [Blautia sp.]